MTVLISIDVGMKSFTGVIMRRQTVLYSCTRDLSTAGKDLPLVVNTLRGVCEHLLECARSSLQSAEGLEVLVEKQIGKFSFAQLESAVYMFFLQQQIPVQQINPKNKLKAAVPGVVLDREFKKKYDSNKYQAKQMLDRFLESTGQRVQTEAKFKKDVADAILQALWYIQQQPSLSPVPEESSPIAEDDNELVRVSLCP